MFILAEMCDVVRIEPRRFAQDTDQEITDELNKKFANKVKPSNSSLNSGSSSKLNCQTNRNFVFYSIGCS